MMSREDYLVVERGDLQAEVERLRKENDELRKLGDEMVRMLKVVKADAEERVRLMEAGEMKVFTKPRVMQ